VAQRLHPGEDRVPPVHFGRTQALALLLGAGFHVNKIVNFDMELLPPGFAAQHPRIWKRVVRFSERLTRTILGRLSSAMLINAVAK
jgi:hypothetical protein